MRARYYVGDYDGALQEAEQLMVSGALGQQKDCLVLRCLLAQGKYKKVISMVSGDSDTASQLVKMQAMQALGKKIPLSNLKEMLEVKGLNDSARTVGAMLYMSLGDYNKAFPLVAKKTNSLEVLLTKIQIHLSLNQQKWAEKVVDSMREIEDEHPLQVLGQIWILLRNGTQTEDAFQYLEDLTSKLDATPMLLNLRAISQMQLGNYEEAYQEIKECQDMLETSDHDGTQLRISLTNKITCLLHLGRGSEVSGVMQQLQKQFPKCAYLRDYTKLSQEFEVQSKKWRPGKGKRSR